MKCLADFAELAERTLLRCRLIAGCSDSSDGTTRTFLSSAMRDCHEAVSPWMRDLGMTVTVDAIGNVRGLLGSGERKRLLVGSHLDTVPQAGAYDGVLGFCLALAMVEAIGGRALPFDVEVLGFSEEEGVRFGVPFLGSLALAGRFDPKLLELQDAGGVSVSSAIRAFGLGPEQIPSVRADGRAFAYLEFHIEQGPVLDRADEAVAIVKAIAGQSRLRMFFTGHANHAGTTPMDLRQDALAGAAEWITAVERRARMTTGLVATVGQVQVTPGAGNVIPGEVVASLDVRHASDPVRLAAVKAMTNAAEQIANDRGLRCRFEELLDQKAVPMDERLIVRLEKAMVQIGEVPRGMVSGAGHDAMILAEAVPSAMVFIRSLGGISHHPGEAVQSKDVEKAIRLGVALLMDFERELETA